MFTVEQLREAMQAAWNDFVADTGCYPDFLQASRDCEIAADFNRSNFVRFVHDRLTAQTSSPASPDAQVEALKAEVRGAADTDSDADWVVSIIDRLAAIFAPLREENERLREGVPLDQIEFPYDATFNAIAYATKIEAGGIGVSVKEFQRAFRQRLKDHPTANVKPLVRTLQSQLADREAMIGRLRAELLDHAIERVTMADGETHEWQCGVCGGTAPIDIMVPHKPDCLLATKETQT